jgi:hypothetical protein
LVTSSEFVLSRRRRTSAARIDTTAKDLFRAADAVAARVLCEAVVDVRAECSTVSRLSEDEQEKFPRVMKSSDDRTRIP